MDGIQKPMGEIRLTHAVNEDFIDAESPLPNQNLLHSLVHGRPRLTPLEEQTPQFMSGIYGYCAGFALAALEDHRDGWTTGTGVALSLMAGIYALRMARDLPRNEGRIDTSSIAKHAAMFGLCAASACIINWRNFC